MRADFGVENRRAQTHQRRGDQDDDILPGDAEQQQTEERRGHADRQRKRLRLLVGEMADHRLQQRRGELERQRDQSDLREVQRVIVLQDRVHRCDQRLHGVVEEVREADAGEHDIGRPRGRLGSGWSDRVRHDHRRDQRFFGDDDRLVQGIIPGRIRATCALPTTPVPRRPAPLDNGCDAIGVLKPPGSHGTGSNTSIAASWSPIAWDAT